MKKNTGKKPATKPQKTTATTKQKKPASRKPLIKPFAIPAHRWHPSHWIPKSMSGRIIRTFQTLSLCRRGPFKRQIHEPSAGVESVCRWSEIEYDEQWTNYLEVDRDIQAGFLARVMRGKSGVTPLAEKASAIIRDLFECAQGGNKDAAHAVANILKQGVLQLSKLALENPRALHPAGEMSTRWPVMASNNPFMRDDVEMILSAVKQGDRLPFVCDRNTKSPPDEWGKIAQELFGYIWMARTENQNPLFDYGEFGVMADELPPFNRETWTVWWKIAKDIFLFSYPMPEALPEFADLLKTKKAKQYPSNIRSKILERIEQRFEGLSRV